MPPYRTRCNPSTSCPAFMSTRRTMRYFPSATASCTQPTFSPCFVFLQPSSPSTTRAENVPSVVTTPAASRSRSSSRLPLGAIFGAAAPSTRVRVGVRVGSAAKSSGLGQAMVAMYSRSTLCFGWSRRCVRSPSLLSKSKPDVSASRRPTGWKRRKMPPGSSVVRSRRPCGSRSVERTPTGLWYAKSSELNLMSVGSDFTVCGLGGPASSDVPRRRPVTSMSTSTSNLSFGERTAAPATVTLPCMMSVRACARDTSKRWLRILSMRSGLALGPLARPSGASGAAARSVATRSSAAARMAGG
mmetsp:Transcript_5693/g.15979  ORF Transcript_5693/g.15979 Transcript_5693/m.15979 type:complete len:301 (-) Transcript_5693:46-948(-)